MAANLESCVESQFYVPGQRICSADDNKSAGLGTYVRQNYIYASIAGCLRISQTDVQSQMLEVTRAKEQNTLPTPGAVVTVRISSINSRFAKCLILCIEETILTETFRGTIRKEDVRLTEIDKVEIHRCFRPRDIVLARVISLGDAHSYILSTAENELGVVMANSEEGVQLVPISWTEMQCPKTFVKEQRKVAKIVTAITYSCGIK